MFTYVQKEYIAFLIIDVFYTLPHHRVFQNTQLLLLRGGVCPNFMLHVST